MSKHKGLHYLNAAGRIAKQLGNMHWVVLACNHGGAKDPFPTGAMFVDKFDQDAPAYAVHFYRKSWGVEKVGFQGINTSTFDTRIEVEGLEIVPAPIPLDLTDVWAAKCPSCGYQPDVTIEELVDVAALWVKSVFGPTIELHQLRELADRWCGEEVAA